MKDRTSIVLKPNSLWEKVRQQTEYALNCGALKSISTNYELLQDGDINFLVRIIANLEHKDNAKKKQKKLAKKSGQKFNPFLPYEKDLFVADISDTHLCLLNKFNVVDYHLLVVTREFEEQETLLTLKDFAALWACLLQIDGLCFYNSGELAGASQRHKHLQLVPFPLIPELNKTPIDSIIETVEYKDNIGRIPCFNFTHGIVNTGSLDDLNIEELSLDSFYLYSRLLKMLGVSLGKEKKPEHYNLLMTREWMMIIPRSQDKYKSISINSLGFAGALLVKNEEQMNTLKQLKPLRILQKVAK
jgi:ATP adenylyltransferase